MTDYDIVIIGGGAAGLSAALVLARARRRVVVVDSGEPRNAPAAHMHGFLGSDGLPPSALLSAGRKEASNYGASLVEGTVAGIEADSHDGVHPRFAVSLAGGSTLRGRRLLVATGLRDGLPDIPGVRERWGRDVLHCPYCHGYEVRDQPLGVIGGTPEAVSHALLVRQWSDDVVYVAQGVEPARAERDQLTARGIRVVGEAVSRLVVQADALTGLELGTGEIVPRAAVFVKPQLLPRDSLLTDLGCAVDGHGWTRVDPGGRTSVAGVWAAGNVVDPRAQVVTAAGEGSAAAIALNSDLVAEDTARALAARDPLHRPGDRLTDAL